MEEVEFLDLHSVQLNFFSLGAPIEIKRNIIFNIHQRIIHHVTVLSLTGEGDTVLTLLVPLACIAS